MLKPTKRGKHKREHGAEMQPRPERGTDGAGDDSGSEYAPGSESEKSSEAARGGDDCDRSEVDSTQAEGDVPLDESFMDDTEPRHPLSVKNPGGRPMDCCA